MMFCTIRQINITFFHDLIEGNLLSDSCIKNAVSNITAFLDGKESLNCSFEDAVYPIKVAEAIEQSYKSNKMETVKYE